MKAHEILNNPFLNKGTAFTMEEREKLGLIGLLPPHVQTIEEQAAQTYAQMEKKENDLEIIHSPVGMPGRAVKSPMLEKLGLSGRIAPKHCSRCIHGCDPGTVKYCITHALISAVEGNVEEGLFFSGANVEKLRDIVSVKEVVDELFPREDDDRLLHLFQREEVYSF